MSTEMKLPIGYRAHKCEDHENCLIVRAQVYPGKVPAGLGPVSAIEVLTEQTPTYHTSFWYDNDAIKALRIQDLMEAANLVSTIGEKRELMDQACAIVAEIEHDRIDRLKAQVELGRVIAKN